MNINTYFYNFHPPIVQLLIISYSLTLGLIIVPIYIYIYKRAQTTQLWLNEANIRRYHGLQNLH